MEGLPRGPTPLHPNTPLHGPLAALLTPRAADGAVDFEALDRAVEHVLAGGGTGLVLTGGTGEYFDLDLDSRRRIFERAAAANRGRGTLVASVGAGRLDDAAELARHALDHGADLILLPPPHFYRYAQTDLDAFFRAAAARIPGPVLIYNLAPFVSPLEAATIVRLIEEVPNIVGVKDSSGRLDALEMLTAAEFPSARVLGNDNALVEALRRGLLDAVISGPASVMPEMIAKLFATRAAGDDAGFERAAALFAEALGRMEALPYPWALKTIAEERGLFSARLPFPPGADRLEQLADFRKWLAGWLPRVAALG
jgi:4-hydroxy-tetrahydrodipicolinate synthase